MHRLYRGLLPELAGMAPTRSAMYGSNEMAKRFLLRENDGKDTAIISGVAGAFSGMAEAIVTTPFQVVKVRLLSKEHLGRYQNSFDCVVKVLRDEGLVAFTTGLSATIFRNSVWNGVYFTTIKCIKDAFPAPRDSKLAAMMHSLSTGFVAGVMATMCNAPFDVAKSRIQAQLTPTAASGVAGRNPTTIQYTSTLQTLMTIGRTEGLGALYKGFTPKAIRMGLGGAVAVTAFEGVCEMAKDFQSIT